MKMELAEPPKATGRRTISSEDTAAISFAEAVARKIVKGAHVRGWGFEAALQKQYSRVIYVRDAMMTLLFPESEEGLMETLKTIFRFRRKRDGALPLKVERVFHKWRYFSRLLGFPRLWPVGVYDDNRLATSSRDTALLVAIACGRLFKGSQSGREFVRKHWRHLVRALEREDKFIDPKDGLLIGSDAPDWYDCVKRPGKLTLLNVLLYQTYREMAWMSKRLGYLTMSQEYRSRSEELKGSIMETFWDAENGYFWAGEKDNHFDACANIAAILILPHSEVTIAAQRSVWETVEGPMGMILDFDRPYPREQLVSWMRWLKVEKYGDPGCYPWMTVLACLAEIQIAEKHKDPAIAAEHLSRAVERFIMLSKLCKRDGTFYEIYDPSSTTFRPLVVTKYWKALYRSNPDFLAAAALWLAVYHKLKEIGVI